MKDLDEILEAVSGVTKLTVEQILKTRLERKGVEARRMVYALLREKGYYNHQIAEFTGRTTGAVETSLRGHADLMKRSQYYRSKYEDAKSDLETSLPQRRTIKKLNT